MEKKKKGGKGKYTKRKGRGPSHNLSLLLSIPSLMGEGGGRSEGGGGVIRILLHLSGQREKKEGCGGKERKFVKMPPSHLFFASGRREKSGKKGGGKASISFFLGNLSARGKMGDLFILLRTPKFVDGISRREREEGKEKSCS